MKAKLAIAFNGPQAPVREKLWQRMADFSISFINSIRANQQPFKNQYLTSYQTDQPRRNH